MNAAAAVWCMVTLPRVVVSFLSESQRQPSARATSISLFHSRNRAKARSQRFTSADRDSAGSEDLAVRAAHVALN